MVSRKGFLLLGFSIIALLLWASCVPAPTPAPIQQTATALQSAFNAQALIGTQQAIVSTAQAFGGPPFLVVTAVGIPITLPPPATLQALTAQPCAFQWITHDAPEATDAAQAAFARNSLLADVSVRAQLYGENCLESDGSVRYFAPMTTDFFLTMELDSFGNLDAVAEVALAALDTLSAPLGVILPAKLGYLDLTVRVEGALGHLRTTFDQITFSRAQGLSGGALVDALGGVVQR